MPGRRRPYRIAPVPPRKRISLSLPAMIRTLPLHAAALATLLPCAFAQNLNCNLRAHVDKFPGAIVPANNYAGVWGLVANDSKEYAAVPARSGTIFYDCSNISFRS